MLLTVEEIHDKVIADMITNPENYAAIYARQSNLSDKVDSIHMQELKGKETALENNLLVYKHYSEKVSATEVPYMEREKLRELIEDAKAGYFKTLIVFRRDRLARNTLEAMKIKNIFKNLNVRILYSSKSEFNSDNSPNSDLIENVTSAIAELEAKIIRERTQSGNKKKRENREHSAGKPAYGFSIREAPNNLGTRNIRYFDPDDNLKAFIPKLFECYISNDNLTNDTGLYNYLMKNKVDFPSDFHKRKIEGILCNPVYAALQTKNLEHKFEDTFKKDIDGNFSHIDETLFQQAYNVTPFVDKETFFTAANKWYRNHNPFTTHTRNTNYLFKDLLICGKCSNKISLSNKTYSCGTAGCTRLKESYLNYEIISHILEDLVSKQNLSTELLSKIKELKTTISSQKVKLIQLTKNEEYLVKEYLNGGKDPLTIKNLEDNVRNQDAIKKNIRLINHNINYYENMKDFSFSQFNKLSKNVLIDVMLTKNHLTRSYLLKNIEKVTIYGRNSDIQYKQ